MSTYATRVNQSNFGYQISNLGILWVVLLIHILNAGYAFYGFAKSSGGEVVLCFLALCLFSIGRWMCACCVPAPGQGPNGDRSGNNRRGRRRFQRMRLQNGQDAAIGTPGNFIARNDGPDGNYMTRGGLGRRAIDSGGAIGGGDPCPQAEPSTRNYYADGMQEYALTRENCLPPPPSNTEEDPDNTGDTSLSSNLYMFPNNEDYLEPDPPEFYVDRLPNEDVCGLSVSQQVYQSRRSSVGYGFEDENWNMDNCDANAQKSDTEVLMAGNVINKPRVVPKDLDNYMPEVYYYSDMDSINDPELIGINEIQDECDRKRARKRPAVQSQLPYRSKPIRMKTLKEMAELKKMEQRQLEDANAIPTSKVVPKARIRSFSPIPPEGRCEPLNRPPGNFRPLDVEKRPIKFVTSTRGIKDFIRKGNACAKPNPYINDEQRREIMRSTGATFDDDCDEVSITRDWPMPQCTGTELSLSSRPSCDEGIVPVPNKGTVREMLYQPLAKGGDGRCRDRNGMFFILNTKRRGRKNAKVPQGPRSRRNQRKPRSLQMMRRQGRVPRPSMMMKMPDSIDGDNISVVVRKTNKKYWDFQNGPDGLSDGMATPFRLTNSMAILISLAMMSLALMVGNPKIFEGFQDIYAKNERACGYFLAAASYILIQSTKDLFKRGTD